MTQTPEAFPLHWPEGYPRTPANRREPGRFQVTPHWATTCLMEQLRLLGARYTVLSTDIPRRRDGLPYAGKENPEDPGVAVYFEYDGEQYVFACDRYDRTHKNMRAVGLTVAALRTIERHGGLEMMRRSFRGFQALPAPDGPPPDVPAWAVTLGFGSGDLPLKEYEERYRALARKHHPDFGESGDADKMAEINAAIAEAREARK